MEDVVDLEDLGDLEDQEDLVVEYLVDLPAVVPVVE